MNNKIGLMGIIGVLMLVVAISGCTSTPQNNSTFTDGKMSFNYLSNFQNFTSTGDIISGSKS